MKVIHSIISKYISKQFIVTSKCGASFDLTGNKGNLTRFFSSKCTSNSLSVSMLLKKLCAKRSGFPVRQPGGGELLN